MIAPLRFLLSMALSVGLASTALASSNAKVSNINGKLAAGYTATGGQGVIFSGNFIGPVSWTLTTLSNGTQNYALAGVLTGMMRGAAINTIMVQSSVNMVRLRANMDRGALDGSTAIAISGSDTTREESVPEPSTLALLGTGSLGLLGVIRRKNGASRN